MATKISRLEFKQRYDSFSRGLYISLDSRKLPKDQETINVGQRLSEILMTIPLSERKEKSFSALESLLSSYKGVTLTNIEILFTPYLSMDIIGVLAAMSRNRKICIGWPGKLENGKAYYAEPSVPEYYECDLSRFKETFIID